MAMMMMTTVSDIDMMMVLDTEMMAMMPTYASATGEQPAGLGNEPLHVGEALLPKGERNVNNVCHEAKCWKSSVNGWSLLYNQ